MTDRKRFKPNPRHPKPPECPGVPAPLEESPPPIPPTSPELPGPVDP